MLVFVVVSFFSAKDSLKRSTNEEAAYGCPRILVTELMHVAISVCLALGETSRPNEPYALGAHSILFQHIWKVMLLDLK